MNEHTPAPGPETGKNGDQTLIIQAPITVPRDGHEQKSNNDTGATQGQSDPDGNNAKPDSRRKIAINWADILTIKHIAGFICSVVIGVIAYMLLKNLYISREIYRNGIIAATKKDNYYAMVCLTHAIDVACMRAIISFVSVILILLGSITLLSSSPTEGTNNNRSSPAFILILIGVFSLNFSFMRAPKVGFTINTEGGMPALEADTSKRAIERQLKAPSPAAKENHPVENSKNE